MLQLALTCKGLIAFLNIYDQSFSRSCISEPSQGLTMVKTGMQLGEHSARNLQRKGSSYTSVVYHMSLNKIGFESLGCLFILSSQSLSVYSTEYSLKIDAWLCS